MDHLRTFGDEHATGGIDFAAQLRFGQGTVNLYAGIGQGGEMKDGHTGVFFSQSVVEEKRPRPPARTRAAAASGLGVQS